MDVSEGRIRLGIEGGLDLQELHQLLLSTTSLLEQDGVIDLHLDLTGAPTMDRTTLIALLDIQECAQAQGRKLVLLNPSTHLRHVLKLTKLERKFEIRIEGETSPGTR
jgi:anti-anti-sigma factor